MASTYAPRLSTAEPPSAGAPAATTVTPGITSALRTTAATAAATALAALVATPAATAAQQATDIDPDRLSAMEARSIGPAAMSGRIGAIQGVPGDPSTIYVGAATGGVWKSTNSGTTWEPIFDEQDASSIGAIAVHPANPELVWVGTGEANMRNSSGVGRGVWRSRDGGATWEQVGLEGTEHIHRIAVHPHDPDVAYVAATGSLWSDGGPRGLYRTTDGGESWERVLSGPNPRTGAVEVSIDPRSPMKVFASLWELRRWPHFFESGGEGSGLYVSHDGGDSWEEIDAEDGLPEGPLGRIAVDVAPSDPSVVYALVESRNTSLLRSDDGGESFEVINASEDMGDRPFYYNDLKVDPTDPERVYHVAGTLRVSTDGGRTFEGAATWGGGVHVDHHALWIDPENPSNVYDGNDGGVYVSRDRAETWRFVTNLPLAQYYEVDVDMDVPYNVYGGLQDNGSWKGPSQVWAQDGIRSHHWTEVGFGDGFGTLDDPQDPRYVFAESQRGYIVRTDVVTGERKSIRPAHPSDSLELRFNWNAPMALDPHRENTLYLGSQFVHRTTDDGLSWERISPDLTTDSAAWQMQGESGGLTLDVTGAENYTTIYTIAPSPVEHGVIWTGSDDGRVHVTRDDGGEWTDLTGQIPSAVPEHAWVSHVEASPHEAGTAFVVFHAYMQGDWGTYVYRVEGYGQSWTRIAGEEVDGFARVVVQDPEVPELLFLGTEFGLWVSLDGGDRWFEWTHGVPTVPVRDLAVHPRDGDLVVATHGRAIYILDDVRPLRALSRDPSLLDGLHVFETPTAWQHEVAPPKVFRFDGSTMFEGENPAYGAHFTFSAAVPDSLRADEEDDTAPADTTSSATAEPGGPPRPQEGEEAAGRPEPEAVLEVLQGESVIRTDTLAVEEGLNRARWDLEVDGFRLPADEDDGDTPRVSGPEVLPGSYTLRLAFAGDTTEAPVEVRFDPRDEITTADRRAKFEAEMRAGRHLETVAEAVDRIRETQRAVEEVTELAERTDAEAADSLKAAGDRLTEALVELEEAFTGPTDEAQGIRRSDEHVMARLLEARGALGSSFDAPTESQMGYLRLAEEALAEAVERTNRVFAEEVADFRERVRAAELELLSEKEPIEAGVPE